MDRGIKVLGSGGSASKRRGTTCIQINSATLIDAGNIINALGEEIIKIENIFLSHSHLDHVADIAYLIDNTFGTRTKPLNIYALPQTIEDLKKYIFNWNIWPDFSLLDLPNSSEKAVNFIPIDIGKKYVVDEDIYIVPIEANHTIECCGFIVNSHNGSILFSSDTFKNETMWKYVNQDENIKALLVDVSFPNRMKNVATSSKHLTPEFLKEELSLLKRDDVHIYIIHIKPMVMQEVVNELKEIGLDENVIDDGDVIRFSDGKRYNDTNSITFKIEKLNRIGIALSNEKDIDKLLEMIIKEAKEITNADGGTLYLLDDKKQNLNFKVVQTDSLGIKMGGKSGKIEWNPLPLYIDGKPNKKMVAATCALDGEVINIEDVYNVEKFDFAGTKAFDKNTGYRSKSMLVIPMKDHEGNVIGVLQLINKTNKFENEIITFDKQDESIIESLASQASVALLNNMLIKDLEELLEAFLKSIIYAISKKSKHTAGHIQRMAKISMMIVDAINKDNVNFKDKTFNEDQKREIEWAALMHDIGKLAIPEYVLDKSKKLTGMYDGVEFIRFRIELIKKELEIAKEKKEITKEEFIKEVDQLNEWFNIIYKSNEGSEYTPDESVKLFEKLSNKIYRLNGRVYKVLSNKEADLLSIRKGTLSEKEREIINSHAKITLDILSRLKFPKKYSKVPSIAANHHEKLNGKGYPRGLKADEISFEDRILAVADIFEALTASDRPYKKANPLSLSMKILYFMAKDGDIDKELVKYFYKSGLYLKYAKKFIPEKYIDKVDVDFDSL